MGAGCRKALSPNTDNNVAPETWITAAPQDTITTRPPVGPPLPGRPGEIPVRYHLYWAGSDLDGAVAGFYWAVVETLPVPPGDGLGIPSLPGPKPQDYRFTARTDSIFIFRASEDVPVREHTFFIYAVDNKGKPDPTPARFMFRAYDRFPPLAVIDSATAVGDYYILNPGGGVTRQVRTYNVTDSFEVTRPFPRDTVPSSSRLAFRWHGEATIPSTVVTGFRYKLDEPSFNVVDSTVRTVAYNTRVGQDVVSPGLKKFTLRAVGESGWRGEATRYFQMNFAPDSWYSGPDVNDPQQGWQSFTDGNGKRYYYKNVNWSTFLQPPPAGGIAGTLLSPDSVNVLPASRPERRTFFEFYQNRIWAHTEGDTVHLNSWVLFPAGGYDPDSPYLVKVGVDPGKPVGVVTTIDPNPNGSPIGFRANITVRKPDGGSVRPTETNTYPIFDVTSSFHEPKISYRGAMTATGKAYAYIVAEDGDGTVDRRLQKAGGAEAVAEDVDANRGTAEQIAVRRKVLTFFVNHAPRLNLTDGPFFPKPGATIAGVNQTFTIIGHDLDAIDNARTVDRVGGPQNPPSTVLFRTVDLIQDQGGTVVRQRICEEFEGQNPNFTPISAFQNGPMTVRVQLSDGRPADERFGRRTVTVDIPVTYSVTSPAGAPHGTSDSSPQSTQRPGSPQAVIGGQ